MWPYALKIGLSAIVLVAVSEIARRSTFWAAALASLPLTSLLAFVWMQVDGEPPERIAQLSTGIFWLVLPSLLLFVLFPALLRQAMNFWLALAISCAATALAYVAMAALLGRFGIRM